MGAAQDDISRTIPQGRAPYEEETDRRQMSRGTYDAAELYVELADIAPTIWRRVRVPTKASLSQLHDILQCLFQWEDSHLHAFYVGEQEYRHPDQIYDDFGAERPKSEKVVKLTDIVEAGARDFLYIYDFGDDWQHQIRLERIVAVADPKDLLVLLGGENAAPPEDCGGAPGYEHMLEVLSDPQAEEYEELAEWVGGEFDPAMLDKKEIAVRLENVRRFYSRWWNR